MSRNLVSVSPDQPLSMSALLTKSKQKLATPKQRVGPTYFDRKVHYTFGEGDPTKQYRTKTDVERSTFTVKLFGQLKCCMYALQFLNLYYNPSEHKDAEVVYVGAAVGTNIAVLAKLYPMLVWHLYDPSKFDKKLASVPNIKLYNTRFEDDDEKKWAKIAKKKPIFFISDIRNMAYDPTTKNIESNKKASLANEQLVVDDMELQAKWVKAIKPKRALLKLRLPYYFPYVSKLEYDYFSGTIYRQVWSRGMSTETRIVPDEPDDDGDYKMVPYHIRSYENMLFYHNLITRQKTVFVNPFSVNDDNIKESDKIAENLGLTNDFDSVCTTQIICDYLIKFGTNPTLDQFRNLAKAIFEGVGDGMGWKYNLYGVRSGVKYRFEDGEVLDQTKVKVVKEEEDPEQREYAGDVE